MTLQEIIEMLRERGGLADPSQIERAFREAAPERDFSQLIDMVRTAIDLRVNETIPPDNRNYINLEAMYADRAIVRIKGRYYQYPYALKLDGNIERLQLGEPVEVVEQYVPVVTVTPDVSQVTEATASDALVTTFREAQDGSIDVTLIRAGKSGNSNYYPDSALREAVPMFEGVRVFVKSDHEHTQGQGKAVRNLIGGIYGVRFTEGQAADRGALTGTFRPIDPDDVDVKKMLAAVKRGMQQLMGLSIDAHARTKVRSEGGARLREAVKFTKVNSVDLIVEPGAGGGLDRLTEAAAVSLSTHFNPEEKAMPLWKQRMLEAIAKKDAARHQQIDQATVSDDEVVQLYESIVGDLAAPAVTQAAPTQRVTESAATGDDAPVTRAELQMIEMRRRAGGMITASKLPVAAKEKLTAQFDAAPRFTEADVSNAIAAEGQYLARFTESGSVRVPAFGAGSIQVGDRSARMTEMLDAFFDPAHKEHRQVRSFKEAYIEITGDKYVTGQMRDVDMGRLRESLGDRYAESLSSSSWANALGDSITRRMQQVYIGQTNLQAWREVATVTSVSDFRQQQRIRVGGYGNLPGVGQGAGYTPLASPSDAVAGYAATKRGGTEDVTLEMIVNDDVSSVRRIPTELALAAANTLYEFAFDFYRSNPVIYDTVALYHATHGNLFTAALSAAEFANHRLAMLKQTRAGSAKRLATAPKSILVPFELQETAFNLFVRNQNLDKTFVQTINPQVIPVSYWTDGNDWVTVADPMTLPVLEIGFLQGREEPELFVQDMPNVGSMFTNDKTTYKIRHIYGGTVLVDGEKGTTKAVVP